MMLPLLLSADTGGGLPGPFQVNFGLTLWTWLVFLVVLILLQKLVFPKLLGWSRCDHHYTLWVVCGETHP